jgi:hypothetical protein
MMFVAVAREHIEANVKEEFPVEKKTSRAIFSIITGKYSLT